MRRIYCALGLTFSVSVGAATENEFQPCVQLKDLTVAIAGQADKGVTRENVKEKFSSRAMDDLVDWVYDFRGAKTTQEMAQKQMDICLEHFAGGKKGRKR